MIRCDTCVIEGCSKPKVARGWCMYHYNSWRQRGSPTAPHLRFMDPEQTWTANTKRMPNGCLEWQQKIHGPHRYGRIMVRGVLMGAHRYAWIRDNGEIPKGFHVCHRCDNRKCVDIDHLFLGTPKQNTRDMFSKGRGRPGHKLEIEDVRAIKRVFIPEGIARKHIAAFFGVSVSTIDLLVTGKTWGGVT